MKYMSMGFVSRGTCPWGKCSGGICLGVSVQKDFKDCWNFWKL